MIPVCRAATLLHHTDRWLSAWSRCPAVVRWLLPLLVAGLLWWSSSRSPEPSAPSVVRALLLNGMHVVAYAALAVAIRLALANPASRTWAWPRETAALVLSVAYGVVDELHQGEVPGRVCSASDVLTDVAGAVFGLLLLAAGRRIPVGWSRLVAAFLVGLACAVNATFASW